MKYLVVLLALVPSIVVAQEQKQADNPAELKRFINILQAQRNQALDALTISDATAAGFKEEFLKTKTELDSCKAASEKKP